jgi:opacity protein-like surface antigen
MKFLVMTALTLVLGGISTTCLADDGNFFINADAGQANYHVDLSNSSVFGNSLNNSDAAGALRFGYRWHSVVDYGLEAGYVDLGNVNSTVYAPPMGGWTQHTNLKDRGWLLGGNLKYNITPNWYVSARGGWFRPQIEGSGTSRYSECVPAPGYLCPAVLPGTSFYQYSYSQTVSGEYFGAGAGYNFSPNFSLGLSYDYYRSGRFNNVSTMISGVNVGTFSVSAEYRF